MPELVTKDSRLLPLGEIFVDCNRPAPQRPLPKPIDCRGKVDEIDETVQLFCDSVRV